MATADGGVIAQSGVTYDQNGNAIGQIANMPTYSWLGLSYRTGSVESVVLWAINVASTYWAIHGGNQSGNNTAVQQQWFPPLDHCAATPGCIGHHEAIYNASLIWQSDSRLPQWDH